jgi:hypothetical protein
MQQTIRYCHLVNRLVHRPCPLTRRLNLHSPDASGSHDKTRRFLYKNRVDTGLGSASRRLRLTM